MNCRRLLCFFNRRGPEAPAAESTYQPESRQPLRADASANQVVATTGRPSSPRRTRGGSEDDGKHRPHHGSYQSSSTIAPTTSNPSSFHSNATTVVPPFIFLVACEVGKLLEFLVPDIEDDGRGISIPESRIAIFSGKLWRWAEEAAVSYWEKHGRSASFSSRGSGEQPDMYTESSHSLGLGYEPACIKEAKEHYNNVILFEYNIDGDNDPSWPDEAWESPRVREFMEQLQKPFLTPAVNTFTDDRGPCSSGDPFPVRSPKEKEAVERAGMSGADKAVLLARVQHVFALAVTIHRLRQEKIPDAEPANDGASVTSQALIDIEQLISDSRAEWKSRRQVQNFPDGPTSLLDMQRHQWLTTTQNLNAHFQLYPQLSCSPSKDPAADEIAGIHVFIMDLLSTHMTEMALEEESYEGTFKKIQARFGDSYFENPIFTKSETMIKTFPSRILWEFARNIGRQYCQKGQARFSTPQHDQAFILRLLQYHEEIMVELEDMIFVPENLPLLRYYYFYVMDQVMTSQVADPTVLKDYLIGNIDLARVIAIGVAFEILRMSGDTDVNMEAKTRLGTGMRGVDMEHVYFCQAASDKPFDVKSC